MESYATAQQVYVAGLVFARVASMIMLMPGLGEASVSPRIRLSFALVTAMCVAPIAAPHLPPLSTTVGGLTGHVLKEVIIGLMLGAILRMKSPINAPMNGKNSSMATKIAKILGAKTRVAS